MKTFNLVSMLSMMVLLTTPTFAQSQNFRSPYSGAPAVMGAPKTFLGLPLPQQWTGTRPASMNQSAGNRSTVNTRNYSQSSPNANGSCANGSCSTGNGNGANGQCMTRRSGFGPTSNSNCANGQCRLNQYPNTRSYSNSGDAAQGKWSPRTTRTNASDPFRIEEYQNRNDHGLQRSGVQNPLNDLMPSRYNSNDLDLRRPYFNDQSGELIKNRASESSSETSHVLAPLPVKRSLIGAPTDRAYGLVNHFS